MANNEDCMLLALVKLNNVLNNVGVLAAHRIGRAKETETS